MNLSGWAIRCRPIVLTLVGLIMAWGVASYFTMPQREDPAYTVRTCVVTTIWPGAPAEKVEELITYPIERAIDRIPAVDIVRSTNKVGMSTIYVDAEETVTADEIANVWDKVRAYVRRVEMPESWIVPDVNDEFGDTSIILFALYQTPLPGEDTIREERRYSPRALDVISERLRDELRLLDGVSKSEQYGVTEEAIYVETSLEEWSQLNLTTDEIARLAQERNIVASGGTIDTDAGRFTVTPGGELDGVQELESIIAGTTRGSSGIQRPVYLRDLGMKIRRAYQDPPSRICRYGDANMREPAIINALTMKPGSNIVDVCTLAKARVKEMQEVEGSLPPDIAVVPISDQSVNVSAKIDQVISNVLGAIIIVIVVVYLVVGFRSAVVMGANIPVVVLAALAFITLFGVELEQISLASIIIALGLLVDNAVQVCDQSRTNQMAGMGPVEASVTGSKQLAGPMFMGTATTIAAFAPMLIGLIGSKREYLYSLPVTLSVTLGLSWILAMTLCTVLAAAFVRAPKDPDAPSGPVAWLLAKLGALFSRGRSKPATKKENLVFRALDIGVLAAVRMKWVTLGISLAALAWALTLPVGSEFFPKDLRDQFAIKVFLPETATIAQTDAVAQQVETILQKLSPTTDEAGDPTQRLRGFRTSVGGGGCRWYLSWDPEPTSTNFAEILVRTSDARYTPWLAQRVREVAENGDEALGIAPIVDARIVPKELFLGPSTSPIELRMFGPGFADMGTLRGYADRVEAMIREMPGAWDVADSWGVSGYEIRVDVDQDKANLAGVTSAAIAQTLNAYFSGHRLTTFREGDHQVPVYLRLAPEQRGSLAGLESAFVEGHAGKVPLESVARLSSHWKPIQIERRDMNRVIEITAETEPGIRGNDVVNAVMASDAMKELQAELPSGYRIEIGGALENSMEGAEQLSISLGISLLTIILLLVVQYNGWAKPLIVLTTLPLALIGAIPGLYFTGNPLGFMPQLGILSLFGIVLNTGIIFIEFADQLIKDAAAKSDGSGPICGLTKAEFRKCLAEACKQRVLPIFLTTATTIGGLLPLAMSGGPLWEGMSWCMIFGLLVATLLTLLVVPALYAILVETFRVKPIRVESASPDA